MNTPTVLMLVGLFLIVIAILGAANTRVIKIPLLATWQKIVFVILGSIVFLLGLLMTVVPSFPGSALSVSTPTPSQAKIPTSTLSPTPTPTFSITSPKDGSSVVAVQITVHGTAPPNIPPDKELWLLVESEGVNGYFPQADDINPKPIKVSSEGKWEVGAYIGANTDPKGTAYVLYLAQVDKNSQGRAAIDQYIALGRANQGYNPIYPLPNGIQLVAEVTVTRA